MASKWAADFLGFGRFAERKKICVTVFKVGEASGSSSMLYSSQRKLNDTFNQNMPVEN